MALEVPRFDSLKDVEVQPLPHAWALAWYLAQCDLTWLRWCSQPHPSTPISEPCSLPGSWLHWANRKRDSYALFLETHVWPSQSALAPGLCWIQAGKKKNVQVRETLACLDEGALDLTGPGCLRWLTPLELIQECLPCSEEWGYTHHNALEPAPCSQQGTSLMGQERTRPLSPKWVSFRSDWPNGWTWRRKDSTELNSQVSELTLGQQKD